MKLLGIDPGSVSGAYALIDTNRSKDDPEYAICGDLPVVDGMVNAAEFARIVRELRPDHSLVERVGVMPKQGSVSGFRFGMGVGIIHGVLMAQMIPMHLVPASSWKKVYRLTRDKELSRALAIRMFPATTGLHLMKHHGRAEALLLAHYLKKKVLCL